MFINDATSRTDLEEVIVANDSLYRSLDEQRFLNEDYSDAELLSAVRSWIEAGDECAAA